MPTDQRVGTTNGQGRSGRLDVAVVSAVLALCVALIGGLAWSHPTRTASVLGYTQSGRLSYSAPASASSIYGEAGVTTGQPVYANAVEKLKFTYAYTFESSVAARLAGSEQLVAVINNGEGITRRIPLGPRTAFTGTKFEATGTLGLGDLRAAEKMFDTAAGSAATGMYAVTISPSVALNGHLGAGALETTFDPKTTFSFTGTALTPSPPPSVTGAEQFTSSTSGSVTVPAGQPATLLGIRVADARVLALAFLPLFLLLALRFGLPVLMRVRSEDERVRIAARYRASFVETDTLPSSLHAVVIELSSFEGLMQVARRLECPILHRHGDDDVYAVVDNGTLYCYSAGPFARPGAHRPHRSPVRPAA